MPTETPAWLGTRKHKEPSASQVTANPIRWPVGSSQAAKKERRDVAGAWFYVAAQAADGRAAMSVLLAMRQWVDLRGGICTATNLTLGKWAGGLSESQVSREISAFAKRGLLMVELGWRPNDDGKPRKTRTIHLAYPNPFPADLSLPTDANDLVPRAQDGGGPKPGDDLAPRAQATSTRAHDYEAQREF